ncbi:MAG: hypothetical protein JO100_14140 [Pseudonocardia sp.]|nr:hypothetical protein [Pseudonocardia sp.]
MKAEIRTLTSHLPELVYSKIWAYLIGHHAISALIAKASTADLEPRPDLRHHRPPCDPPHCHRDGGHSPKDWEDQLPAFLARIAALRIPTRHHPPAHPPTRRNMT